VEIKFTTKEQSNIEQEQAFLKLSPHERFVAFIRLSNQILKLPTRKPQEKKNNFVVSLYHEENA
jgi:hypothetical protein